MHHQDMHVATDEMETLQHFTNIILHHLMIVCQELSRAESVKSLVKLSLSRVESGRSRVESRVSRVES